MSFLSYPPDGGEVEIFISNGDEQVGYGIVNLDGGTAPQVFNVTCSACYADSEALTVLASLSSDPSTTFSVDPESIAITSLSVVDGASPQATATASVTLSGLVATEQYVAHMWCINPFRNQAFSLGAGPIPSTTLQILPGTCTKARYLIVSSADGAHVVVAQSE